jgi:hypothetical protein
VAVKGAATGDFECQGCIKDVGVALCGTRRLGRGWDRRGKQQPRELEFNNNQAVIGSNAKWKSLGEQGRGEGVEGGQRREGNNRGGRKRGNEIEGKDKEGGRK